MESHTSGVLFQNQRPSLSPKPKHPFELKYERPLGNIPWEECSAVLDKVEIQEALRKGW